MMEKYYFQSEFVYVRLLQDQLDELEPKAKGEMAERKTNDSGDTYYVDADGSPLEGSILEDIDKIVDEMHEVEKSRPDLSFGVWRLVLLDSYIKKSLENGLAVGFS